MGLFSKKEPEPQQIELYWLNEDQLAEWSGFPLGSTWSEIGKGIRAEDCDQDILEPIHDALAANGIEYIPVILLAGTTKVAVVMYGKIVGTLPDKYAAAVRKHAGGDGIQTQGSIMQTDGTWTVHVWVLDKYLR